MSKRTILVILLTVVFAVSVAGLLGRLPGSVATSESALLPEFWLGATVLAGSVLVLLLVRRGGRARDQSEKPGVTSWADAVETLPVGLAIYDTERKLAFCNSAWRRLFADVGGFTAIGSHYDDLTIRVLGSRKPASPASTLAGEHRLERGSWVWFSETPLDDGTLVVSARDVTNERQHESQVRTEQERSRLIISATGAWIWETDVLHRFSRVIPVRSELSQDELRWMVGRGLAELAPIDKTSRSTVLSKCIEDMRERRRLTDVSLVLQHGQTQRAVRLSGVPRSDRDGAFLGYCGIGMFETLPFGVIGSSGLRPSPPGGAVNVSSAHARRILLVDDSQTNRLLGLSILKKMGYECAAVQSGHEAVEALRDGAYGLVLMDIRMPGIDGFETTERIRALPEPACSVHIVAMTAHVNAEDRQRCLEAGMDDHVPKPVDRRVLSSVLERLIGPPPGGSDGHDFRPPPPIQGRTGETVLADDATLEQLRDDAGPDLVRELVASYMTETEERLPRMQAALKSGDLESLAAEAHAMKSSSGTFGAVRLQQHVERLEKAAAGGDGTLAAEMLNGLPDLIAESWRDFARAGYPPPE